MHSQPRRPVDRKMVINGLNSGANVYMADFEGQFLPIILNSMQIGHILCTSD